MKNLINLIKLVEMNFKEHFYTDISAVAGQSNSPVLAAVTVIIHLK